MPQKTNKKQLMKHSRNVSEEPKTDETAAEVTS